MSRLTNAILQPGQAYGAGHLAPMVDPQFGGQMGFSSDLTEWVSNAAYIRKPLICLLVEAPKGFQYLPNPDMWIATLRAMVELHPQSIEGLNMGLEVEFAENPFGAAGEMQEDFTDVKRTRSQVTFRIPEKYGMPFANFNGGWIRNLMMDPDTKYAAVASFNGVAPADWLPDMYTATMIFIEPDPLHQKVVKSWLGTNMMPKGTGEIVGRRDPTTASEPTVYDLGFTGIYQSGEGVNAFAQRLLDNISLTGANPWLRPAFVNQISADVLAMKKGYENGVEGLGATALRV